MSSIKKISINGTAYDLVNTLQDTISLSTTWSGSGPYTQTVTLGTNTPTSNTKVDIQPDSTVITQLISDGVKALYIENTSGTLTAVAVGGYTSVALSGIQVTLTEIG